MYVSVDDYHLAHDISMLEDGPVEKGLLVEKLAALLVIADSLGLHRVALNIDSAIIELGGRGMPPPDAVEDFTR